MAIIPSWKTEQQILQLFPAVLVLVTAQHSQAIKDTKGNISQSNMKKPRQGELAGHASSEALYSQLGGLQPG